MNDSRIEYRFKLNDIQEEVFKRTSMLARGENSVQYNELVLSRGEDFMFQPYIEAVASELFDFIVPFCRKKYNIWEELEEKENPTEPDPLVAFGMLLDRKEDFLAIDKRIADVTIKTEKVENIDFDRVPRSEYYTGKEVYATIDVVSKELKPTDILLAKVHCDYIIIGHDGVESELKSTDKNFRITNMKSKIPNPIAFANDDIEDFIIQREYYVQKYAMTSKVQILDKEKFFEDYNTMTPLYEKYGNRFVVEYSTANGWTEQATGDAFNMTVLKAYSGFQNDKDTITFTRYKNFDTDYKEAKIKDIKIEQYVIVNQEADEMPIENYLYIGDELWYKFDEFDYQQTNRYMDVLMYCTYQLDWFDENAKVMLYKAMFEALVNGIIAKWTSIIGDNDISLKYQMLYEMNINNMRNRLNTQKKPVRRKYNLF